MCLGARSSPPPPPPPPPNPAISNREDEQASQKLSNQAADVQKRKQVAYGMSGSKRKLISSSGAGFLGAGQKPTLGD
jgi:hypothetical protein